MTLLILSFKSLDKFNQPYPLSLNCSLTIVAVDDNEFRDYLLFLKIVVCPFTKINNPVQNVFIHLILLIRKTLVDPKSHQGK